MSTTSATRPDTPETFDLTAALPTGTAVLEASAGTGKTYAIAALATRFVAEAGRPVSELLLVTFTRAATAELGGRVRARFLQAADHLDAILAGVAVTGGDDLLDHLAAAPREELALRRSRLVTALTQFDAAPISTIHGFCQQMLRAIGLASGAERDLVLLEDERPLLSSIVADLLVARFQGHAGAPKVRAVTAAVQEALRAPDATLAPTGDPTILPVHDQLDHELLGGLLDDPLEQGRRVAAIVDDARAELSRRKRRLGLVSQDDLLTRLRDALVHPGGGAAAIDALRQRVSVAIVDEFQDTDPIQWEILRTAFAPAAGDRTRSLLLIGDPKQAIYRFRGADVRAYLDATTAAGERRGLAVNWRSDGPLVDALHRLLDGTTYGPGIVHRPVVPAPEHRASRLAAADPQDALPLEVRAITRLGSGTGKPGIGEVRATLLPSDVASEVVETLQARGTTIDGRPVRPRDIALLVRSNADAVAFQRALREVGVPAVLNGVGNVFASDAADAWVRLLEAIERPGNEQSVRALAASPLLGWDAGRLCDDDPRQWDELHGSVADWAELLRASGVAPLLRSVASDTGLHGRVLRTLGGERLLMDLQHVAQLLEEVRAHDELGAAALLEHLRQRIDEAGETEVPPDAQARRLESDAEAVQILTVHRSKGLEFPIVLCPTLWASSPAPSAPFTVHADDGGRVVDVGPKDRPGAAQHQAQAAAAQREEDLRLLYVALTRARHRVVLWWVANDTNRTSALARVLFSRTDGRVDPDGTPKLPAHDATFDSLGPLLDAIGGRAVEVPPRVVASRYRPPGRAPSELAAAVNRRRLDTNWRRTSYSGLTALVHHHQAGATTALADPSDDDGDLPATLDEPLEPDTEAGANVPSAPAVDAPGAGRTAFADDGRDLRDVPLPLAPVRGSAELGTMVHAVLEHADFAAPDLAATFGGQLEEQATRAGLDSHLDVLRDGLLAALRTPLGSIADDRCLADISRSDRLDEPRFELPIAGGDVEPGLPPLAVSDLAELLRRHLPSDDPLASYADHLDDPALRQPVRGYLNGAIDLVLRLRSDGGSRYIIVDHKTNRLGWPDTPTAYHYRPEALASAMMSSHYPLQALIYTVALHRFLRWRQVGYDPAIHLGGVAYLYLRGMTGPDVPRVGGQPCGVFAWLPPTSLVLALDEVVAGRAPTRPRAEGDER